MPFILSGLHASILTLNRCPTLAVKNKTPEEAWSGIKPSVDHFRVFGCVSHVHVPDSRRVKLDAKSLKCILLRVSEESKAYRLFNPTSNKIIVSRDVVFEEDQQWCWDDNHKHNLLTDLEWETQEAADTDDGEIKADSGADAELRAISGEQEPEFDEEESALNGLQPGVDDEEQNTPNSNILEHQG